MLKTERNNANGCSRGVPSEGEALGFASGRKPGVFSAFLFSSHLIDQKIHMLLKKRVINSTAQYLFLAARKRNLHATRNVRTAMPALSSFDVPSTNSM